MPYVYAVPGYYIAGIPHVEHECDGEGLHHICLQSGAFTETPPDEPAAEAEGSADAEPLSVEE